jgi:hypothetical protein
MSLSRRKFIKAGTIMSISAAAPLLITDLAFGQKALGPSPIDRLSRLAKEDFHKYLSTTFQITVSSRKIDFDLYAVEEMQYIHKDGVDCFRLVFRSLYDIPLAQKTYTFSHSQLGVFDLFITPAGVDGRMRYYGAIINRLPR